MRLKARNTHCFLVTGFASGRPCQNPGLQVESFSIGILQPLFKIYRGSEGEWQGALAMANFRLSNSAFYSPPKIPSELKAKSLK